MFYSYLGEDFNLNKVTLSRSYCLRTLKTERIPSQEVNNQTYD